MAQCDLKIDKNVKLMAFVVSQLTGMQLELACL